jgi:hypothetical protein
MVSRPVVLWRFFGPRNERAVSRDTVTVYGGWHPRGGGPGLRPLRGPRAGSAVVGGGMGSCSCSWETALLVALLPVERGTMYVARLAERLAAEAEDRGLINESVDDRDGLGG